jgi:hypothetical protein
MGRLCNDVILRLGICLVLKSNSLDDRMGSNFGLVKLGTGFLTMMGYQIIYYAQE